MLPEYFYSKTNSVKTYTRKKREITLKELRDEKEMNTDVESLEKVM